MVEVPVKLYISNLLKTTRESARKLGLVSGPVRNAALQAMAERLGGEQTELLEANRQDIDSIAKGLDRDAHKEAVDRIRITDEGITSIAASIRQIAELPDPVGQITQLWRQPNGMQVSRMRVPLGVIGVVSDRGPRILAESLALCLKTGNVCIYRGGTEWPHSNRTMVKLFREAAEQNGIPQGALLFLDRPEREAVLELIKQAKFLDAVVPRGGAGLRRTVMEQARIPVLGHDAGPSFVYLDGDIDVPLAQNVVINSKAQDPTAGNAVDTILVHQSAARHLLSGLLRRLLSEFKVDVRGCPKTVSLMGMQAMTNFRAVEEAKEEDWGEKFQAPVLAVKIVSDLDEALSHMAAFGPCHTVSIVSRDYDAVMRFVREVDASAVLINASTRLNEGEEMGVGTQMGVSSTHIHARGPLGPEALTCQKYVMFGTGQLRHPHPVPDPYEDAMMLKRF